MAAVAWPRPAGGKMPAPPAQQPRQMLFTARFRGSSSRSCSFDHSGEWDGGGEAAASPPSGRAAVARLAARGRGRGSLAEDSSDSSTAAALLGVPEANGG